MRYLPELYYFFDERDFPLEKAVLTTALEVSKYSKYYKAKLITPIKGLEEIEKVGILPEDEQERMKFVSEIIEWIFRSSSDKSLFTLLLSNFDLRLDKSFMNGDDYKFGHFDDTCCWILNLEQIEFDKLKEAWTKNNLPTDLFYAEDQAVIYEKPIGLIGKLLKCIGFTVSNTQTFSPKEWELENK